MYLFTKGIHLKNVWVFGMYIFVTLYNNPSTYSGKYLSITIPYSRPI